MSLACNISHVLAVWLTAEVVKRNSSREKFSNDNARRPSGFLGAREYRSFISSSISRQVRCNVLLDNELAQLSMNTDMRLVVPAEV